MSSTKTVVPVLALMARYQAACELKQPVNPSRIADCIERHYKALGLTPKPLNILGSLEAARAARAARDAWDVSWITTVCLGAAELNDKKTLSIYLPLLEAFEAGLWTFFYFDDCFAWLPLPVVKTKNNGTRRQLHSDTGPAFELPEQKLYFLNGVLMPEAIVLTPAQKIDPVVLFQEKNAEVKREIVRKVGVERIIQKLGAETIDKQGDYELLLIDLKDGRKREYLKMKNPSIGVWHVEGVAPGIKTVHAALAWRNGIDLPPAVLT